MTPTTAARRPAAGVLLAVGVHLVVSCSPPADRGGDPQMRFPVRIGGEVGLIDGRGELVVEPRFLVGGDMREGLMPVADERGWGFVDAGGRFVVAPEFAGAQPFSEGRAAVLVDEGQEALAVPLPEATGEPLDLGALLDAVSASGRRRAGYVDPAGDLVIEARFTGVSDFSEGLAAVRVDERWGYLDRQGEWAIEPRFGAARPFHQGRAAVQVGERWGFVDPSGEMAIPARFAEVGRFAEGAAPAREDPDGTWGFVGRDGAWALDPVYFWAWHFAEGLAPVRIGAHWGFVDADGEVVIEPAYRSAQPFSEGRAAVEGRDGRWGFVDRQGDLAVDPVWDLVQPFAGGLAMVRRGSLYGWIDREGRVVWEPSE